MFKAVNSIRTRILAIALVPSIVLLTIGIGVAGYLAIDGRSIKNWSTEIQRQNAPGMDFAVAVQQERRMTLMKLAGDRESSSALTQQRRSVDDSMQAIARAAAAFSGLDSDVIRDQAAAFGQLTAQLAIVRTGVDSGTQTIQDVYAFYNRVIDVVASGMAAVTHKAPDPATALEDTVAGRMFLAAEAMSRGNAFAAALLSGGKLTPEQLWEFSHQIGYYHTELVNLGPLLSEPEQLDLRQLTAGPIWQRLVAVENSILTYGATAPAEDSGTTTRTTAGNGRTAQTTTDSVRSVNNLPELPVSMPEWQDATTRVGEDLLNLWQSHQRYTQQIATDTGTQVARNSMLAGAAVLLVAIGAFLIALRLSSRVIRRLKRLRAETLALADEQLPAVMDRLSSGEPVDLDTEVSRLQFGDDEVGQVADAFNRAQLAAVSAAATEAKTRAGVNAVFLNIAHRSQLMMHRQLDILYKAEYELEDPELLNTLYQLDHLATRERRNAENLIILGGAQPRRRWRNPVPLLELVRSAVAETQDYTRVRTARVPDIRVIGTVVADLIHLLSELVDNATSFSPPDSRVEVSGNIVGRGAVVEIVDQGLGISGAQLDQINETLRNPPDFALATLTSDSRLGMFVVARLATRHDIAVRLAESDYGGIRAIVLIPSALLSNETGPGPDTTDTTDTRPPRRRRSFTATWPTPDNSAAPSFGNEQPPTPDPVTQRPRPWSHHDAPAIDAGPDERTNHQSLTTPTAHPKQQQTPSDGRPPLPHRRRQENLAPHLADPPAPPRPESSSQAPARPAEQARDLFSAIEIGTRQGRLAQPEPRPTTDPDE
ncbi:nitrate- and nitrite sensing domain-containing protein [Nocardia sp. NBC_00565]|uniref:sensor histidine kinase n=1 Tax=Nocardia sp. NBC_00565 TaxID=2975993 RepID=UPI002E823D9E|nr:nitrate- and nitrite sensing domain-containing protein [Nocardia sp. NBC_00565]WUC05741.1 nitrate- and nitrite sensing domain-containing protein [Nocardia sp. NBC_00565]